MNQSYANNRRLSSPASGNTVLSSDGAAATVRVVHLLDRPIAFHRCFVEITGSITAALMLSQALYWQRRTKDPAGWWYKTRDEWTAETGMSRYEQEGARKKLRKLGILQEERRGIPAQLWYRVDEARLLSLLQGNVATPCCEKAEAAPAGGELTNKMVENPPTGQRKTSQQDGGKPANKMVTFPPSSKEAETTTETTSETTTTTAAAPTEPTANPTEAAPTEAGGSGSSPVENSLIFDFHLKALSEAERQRATAILGDLSPTLAQQVLDEFNYATGCGCIKQSRWAWLRAVAQSAHEGRFTPTTDLAERRARQASQANGNGGNPTVVTLPARRTPSQAWADHREELMGEGMTAGEYATYIAPLRGREDGRVLWLEAPNHIVAEWVLGHLPQVETVIQPHTALPLRVCIG